MNSPSRSQPMTTTWTPSNSDTFCVLGGCFFAVLGGFMAAGLPGVMCVGGLLTFIFGIACDLRSAAVQPKDDAK
jgi:hypothetical protein